MTTGFLPITMNQLTTHKHRVSSIRHWASCGENPTLAHFRHFSSLYTNEYRVSRYESFLQNKPNLLDSQMNVNKVLTKGYENKRLGGGGVNKANQSQINPINPISKLLTQYMVYCPVFPDSLLWAAPARK